MNNNGQGIEDVPPGVPGRIRMCEWCGQYTNNFVMDGDMVFCPACNRPSLMRACAKCDAPIPFPPQLYCLSCGERLTIMPMVEQGKGYVPAVITEPEKERREQLESKGNNWYDVLRGRAEGAEKAPTTKAKPPGGWTNEDFNKLIAEARGQAGEQPVQQQEEQAPAVRRMCKECAVKLTFQGPWDEYKCPICGNAAVEIAGQNPAG